MHSVLNEENTLLQSIIKKFTNDKKRSNNSAYLKGSITRYTKNLIMSFPLLCDTSIPADTAVMLSKANERNMADLLQMMFASMNINSSKNGAEILSNFYKGLDPYSDINDIIDALDWMAGQNNENIPGAKFEQAQFLREAVEEFKKMKPFPKDNFSERSLNEYTVKQGYNSVVVAETTIVKEADNNTDKDELNKQRFDHQKDQDEIKNKMDSEKFEHQKAKDLINLNQNRLTANDVRKANELQPLLLVVNYYTTNAIGGVQRENSFLAGVKSRLIPTDAVDIMERFSAKNRTKLSLKNLVRATTGEINLVKDLIACTKQAKIDARNAAKKGPMANIWHILEKRGAKNAGNKRKSSGNDASAITSVALSQETVNYMKNAYNFDLENLGNTRLIMDSFNLLGIFICDEATETVKVFYDGYYSYELLSYSSLERETSNKEYKKMINMINNQAR